MVRKIMNEFELLQEKFKEYKKATGGKEIIGLCIVGGYPPGVEEMGGPIAVYDECIKRGITWQELLDYHEPPEGIII